MKIKFKKALGITLIVLVFLAIFGYMIDQSGLVEFLKVLGLTIALVVIIVAGVILAVGD